MNVPDLEANAILVDSVSKRYSACGARIGCIASKNKEVMSALLKFAQARLCPPTVDQLAALACIDLGDEYFHPLISEYEARRDLAYNALLQIPDIVCVKPQGAFYILATLPVDNVEEFVTWMLDEFSIDGATMMGAPGDGFYATPGLGLNEMRLAYVLNQEDLSKAMHILTEGIEAYNKIKG